MLRKAFEKRQGLIDLADQLETSCKWDRLEEVNIALMEIDFLLMPELGLIPAYHLEGGR